MNIILIGYRCWGKTSVGKNIAARLQRAFDDTDILIQEDQDRTIREIVAADGWTAFRAEEKKVIARLSLQDRCVVALGGGAVLDRENLEAMRINGRIVWLQADVETILERMRKDQLTVAQRPPLSGQDSIRETTLFLEERMPLYEAAADIAINTQDKPLDDLVEEILILLAEEV